MPAHTEAAEDRGIQTGRAGTETTLLLGFGASLFLSALLLFSV